MKIKYLSAALLFLFLLSLSQGFADDSTISLVIAPPPVGYPVFEEGSKENLVSADLLYTSVDFGGTDITILGPSVFGIYQYAVLDTLAVNASIGASVLVGSEYNMLLFQVPLFMSMTYQFLSLGEHTFFVTAGGGGDIGLTSMSVVVPQVVGWTMIEDETTLRTLTTTGRLSGSLQANISLGSFILSPFGTYTYTAGNYSSTMESSMSFDYPSSSGRIDGYSTTILGFDLLYKPLDLSLSSMIRRSDRMTLISISLKWLLPAK